MPRTRNERTSAAVASAAGRLMKWTGRTDADVDWQEAIRYIYPFRSRKTFERAVKACAASCLKPPKRKAKKAVRK